ncbi:MAG: outer rane lipoprotein carrier protein LolA [Gemmatimonadetes bacterium]|jgi:outer membrane lipoprotein carrier protein|nr:outer rane lipoprotein carrier protein LolA [Gemmatimonadota bacterium]
MTARTVARSAFVLTLAAGLPALTAPAAASAQAARTVSARADLLDRAVSAWAKVKTARATFEQSIVNPLTGNTMKTSGEYQQQRPGKLSVRFADPASDRIVADGRYVWLYLPSTAPGQVIRTDLAGGGTGTVDLSAQFLTAPRTRYTVTETGASTVSGRPTHGYLLVPKTRAGAPFTKAEVQIDDADATIRQFTVIENSGLERTVRLTAFRTNVPVQSSAFVFTPPAGTRIVAH